MLRELLGVVARKVSPHRRTWVAFGLATFAISTASAQVPTTFTNLQYFRKDIPREELIERMRQFSFALGVRCQHCHTGDDGVSFVDVDFASDQKEAKRTARQMLRMVDEINGKLLPMASGHAPAVTVGCVTCHRALPVPRTLDQVLRQVVDAEGADAAVAKYRQLRTESLELGLYNFGEWTINELAADLHRGRKTDAAIALLRVNAEFNPKSADIHMALGEMYLSKGDRASAIERFKAVLRRQPNNPRAKQRLSELQKEP